MSRFTQRGRLMSVNTLLGEDALLLERLTGTEAVSELFEFRLDLLAEPDTPVPFDKLLGRPAAVTLTSRSGVHRYVHGIVSRLSQGVEVRGGRGQWALVRYAAVVVPAVWRLTRRTDCRIFQQIAVPDILKQVFDGFDVSFRLRGTYEPRDYCVQYRETDWAFASRLMEEEGICYYFAHRPDGHTLVVADHTGGHDPVPAPDALLYDPTVGGVRPDDRVTGWVKSQELRSGCHTLWDHTFELPGHNLEGRAATQTDVSVGTVSHRLAVGGNERMELYDYPGGYAQRFDGVGPGGGDRLKDLEKVFKDNGRTAQVRMEQEAARAVEVTAESTCRQLTPGHRFSLAGLPHAAGEYVVTRVDHRASLTAQYLGVPGDDPEYANAFRAVPRGLPYRPAAVTPKARVWGTQTATVVGPPGEEIFTDKYGRVKVQFPWDRRGKMDAASSCWVRVAQVHAGKRFGGIDIPRVGQEVVVGFEEGDPDRPIVLGRVYNAHLMPPFDLPAKRMVSGLKSNTYPGGSGSNEISMDDSKGAERMYLHAQYNQDEVVENNQTSKVGKNRTVQIGVDDAEQVGNNQIVQITNNQLVGIGANQKVTVGENILITAGTSITLQCGAAVIHMNQAGLISISGSIILATGTVHANVSAPLTVLSGVATFTAGVLTVSEGAVVNKVMGGITTVDGTPVKINC